MHRQGHENVLEAENGRQALEIMAGEPVDLLPLDIMMPEMNGYEVLEHVKADEDLRHVPVIMISALDEMESVVRCIKIGAEDYLPKPFNTTLPKARIKASLDRKKLRDREVAPPGGDRGGTGAQRRIAARHLAGGRGGGVEGSRPGRAAPA